MKRFTIISVIALLLGIVFFVVYATFFLFFASTTKLLYCAPMKRFALYFIAAVAVILTAFTCDDNQYECNTSFQIRNETGEDIAIRWYDIEKQYNCFRIILRDGEVRYMFSQTYEDFMSSEEVALRLRQGNNLKDVIVYCPADSDSGVDITDMIYDQTGWVSFQTGAYERIFYLSLTPEDIKVQ